jgi:hypothetical protein
MLEITEPSSTGFRVSRPAAAARLYTGAATGFMSVVFVSMGVVLFTVCFP